MLFRAPFDSTDTSNESVSTLSRLEPVIAINEGESNVLEDTSNIIANASAITSHKDNALAPISH